MLLHRALGRHVLHIGEGSVLIQLVTGHIMRYMCMHRLPAINDTYVQSCIISTSIYLPHAKEHVHNEMQWQKTGFAYAVLVAAGWPLGY